MLFIFYDEVCCSFVNQPNNIFHQFVYVVDSLFRQWPSASLCRMKNVKYCTTIKQILLLALVMIGAPGRILIKLANQDYLSYFKCCIVILLGLLLIN